MESFCHWRFNLKKIYLLIHSTACFFYKYLVINVSPKDTESVSLSLSLLSPLWNRGRVLGDRMSACTRESFGDVWISMLSIRGSEILLKGKFPYTINCYWKWNFYVPIRSFLNYSLKSPDIIENNKYMFECDAWQVISNLSFLLWYVLSWWLILLTNNSLNKCTEKKLFFQYLCGLYYNNYSPQCWWNWWIITLPLW